jgi:hypothetical protein
VGAFDKAKHKRAARIPVWASQWVSARFDTSFNLHRHGQIIAATDKSKKHTQKKPTLQSPTSSTASGSTP